MDNKKTFFRPGLDLAVIGMAGRFPGAKNIGQFWENLKAGNDTIHFFSSQELEKLGYSPEKLKDTNFIKAGGILEDSEYFDSDFFGYTPGEAEDLDPQIRIFHECVWTALEDAGYSPDTYEGVIGLYAGASNNSSWEIATVMNHPNLFEIIQYADKDHMCTRISHKLNLTGPSFIVETQCSTSLLAVHLACQGLLSGECEIALAGGISIVRPMRYGYIYEDDMLFSPDGHCRTFDQDARGIIFGNGVGVVALKRIEDAIAHGDHIYGLIKGTAVNNDGRRKISYSAPSVDGQREVIRMALRLAQVEPESISYVETHGTGTSLGDPIEIQALKLAFKTDRKRFCGVGSVKTNVGHLDNAAGITGLIKTLLALKHKMIPPSLHFKTPNPTIDFENSPFYVNASLTPWKNDRYPLRAGVSSFGIGGTNVHAILEEWPGLERKKIDDDHQYQLIPLSAKTQTALDKMSDNLFQHFKENPGLNLADAAYTLQTGRSAFAYRKILVCKDIHEACESLRSAGSPKIPVSYARDGKGDKKVVFMFPGLGAQYVNMGRELYEKIPVFRREMDHCFEVLKALMDDDIKGILYPPDTDNHAPDLSEDINRFDIAQAAIFMFEYALAQLLIHWGIKPHALVGYSFGEYAAACVSGVFSLEDALKLAVARGKLIQRLPRGAMLSVPLPAREIAPLLNQGVSLAIDNGPSCIVAGANEAVEDLENQLKNKRLMSMRVQNTHALHSNMMKPIEKELETILAKMDLNQPKIPYISNMTGDWIKDEDALDPRCWAAHSIRTVRFARGIKQLVNESYTIFIEVGPGRDISALVSRHIEDTGSRQHLINLVRAPHQNIPDTYYLFKKIGQLWIHGITPHWQTLNPAPQKQRITLPTYPFEGKKFGNEKKLPKISMVRPKGGQVLKKKDIADWFYIPLWKRSILENQPAVKQKETLRYLVFLNESSLASLMVNRLKQEGHLVVSVKEGPAFTRINNEEYLIDVTNESDYLTLFQELRESGTFPRHIIHMWNLSVTPADNSIEAGFLHFEEETFAQDMKKGFYSLLYMARSMGKLNYIHDIQIDVLSNHLHEVIGEEFVNPTKATLLGPVKVISQEYTFIHCRSIDIILPSPGSPGENQLCNRLMTELAGQTGDTIVAYRGNYRWVQVFESMHWQEPGESMPLLKKNGVYLITGGLGYIGSIISSYLAEKLKVRLILTGRTSLPPRDEWDQWLLSHPEENPISKKILKIKDLEKTGAQVLFFGVDISDLEGMQLVINEAEKQFGPINGVIHAAGNFKGSAVSPIERVNKETYLLHFKPKIQGLIVLEKVLKNKTLDFCLLASSLSSILGGLGLITYSAANAFMDAFAHRLKHDVARRWLSVNWSYWQFPDSQQTAANRGTSTSLAHMNIAPHEGIQTFTRILYYWNCQQDLHQVAVSPGDFQALIDRRIKLESLHQQDEKKSFTDNSRPDLANPYLPPLTPLEKEISRIWGKLFGFKTVGIQDDFFDLGGDSLKAIGVISRLQKKFYIRVSLEDFLNKPTIEELARYIESMGKEDYNSVQPEEKKEYYPASSVQKRLYSIQMLQPDTITYNESNTALVGYTPEKNRLKKAVKRLIERHETLRTSFEMIDGEIKQRIHDVGDLDIKVEFFDVTEPGNKINPNKMIKNFIKPFELSRAPLMRFGVIRQNQDKTLLIMDMHHIIADDISQMIFIKDFKAFYGGKEPEPLRIQYKDFALQRNKESTSKKIKLQKSFWEKQFQLEPKPLILPYQNALSESPSLEGVKIHFEIGKEETLQAKQMARQEKVTLFMFFFAVYYILLEKITGQEDIIIGTVTSERTHPDLKNVMGMFVNTLVIRNYPEQNKTFKEFLEEVKKQTLEAFDNQDYSLEALNSWLLASFGKDLLTIVKASYTFGGADVQLPRFTEQEKKKKVNRSNAVPGINIYDSRANTAKTDISLAGAEVEGILYFSFEYNSRLLTKSIIQKFIDYFKEILSAVIKDNNIQLKNIKITHGFSDQKIALPKTGFNF